MKKLKIVIFILIVVIVALLGYIFFKPLDTSTFEQQVNKVTKISEEERQKQLNQIVEDGMMNVTYSPKCVFDGRVSKTFVIVNIDNNKHPIKFEIYDENGEVVYSSKKIDIGYQLSTIELNKDLEKGKHNCIIKIGYDTEGNVSSEFPLEIEVI